MDLTKGIYVYTVHNAVFNGLGMEFSDYRTTETAIESLCNDHILDYYSFMDRHVAVLLPVDVIIKHKIRGT
jgi:hypothetical protein